MSKINEEHIEKFVAFPELLTKKQKELIEQSIGESDEVKELANWFEEFYYDLDELETNIIKLQPVNFKSNTNDKNLVLAARSSADSEKVSIETVATFASEKDEILLRLLYFNDENEYQFHLLRDFEPADTEISILSIQECDLDFIIDQSRHVNFSSDKEKIAHLNWGQANIALRFPIAEYTISAKEIDELTESEYLERQNLKIYRNSKSLSIRIIRDPSETSREISRMIIQNESGNYRIFRLKKGQEINFQHPDSTSLRIWLFK